MLPLALHRFFNLFLLKKIALYFIQQKLWFFFVSSVKRLNNTNEQATTKEQVTQNSMDEIYIGTMGLCIGYNI